MGQSRMGNPETLATLGTRGEDEQRKNYDTESYKDEQHGPQQNPVVNPGTHEGKVFSASYKTPGMLHI